MVMSIDIHSELEKVQLICGYESGHTMVMRRANSASAWQIVYKSQSHSQPGV